MSTVIIPAALRRLTGQTGEFHTGAPTVQAALEELAATWPALRPQLFDDQGQPRGFVRLYLGEEPIESLDGLQTTLGPRDELLLLPPIAGG